MSSLSTQIRDYQNRGLWSEERVGYLLEQAATRWSDRNFLYFDGKHYSFSDLHRWVTVVARDLVKRKLKPDDRVLIQSANCMELLVLQMAVWRVGAISVPIVPVYRVHEMRAILNSSRPTIIAATHTVGSRVLAAEIDQILAEIDYKPQTKLLFGTGHPMPGWDAIPPAPPADIAIDTHGLPEPGAAEKCCMILFTSGTTSAPKGAVISSRAMLSGMHNWQLGLELSSRDVTVAGAPLVHVAALMSAFLVPLSIGARTVVLPQWNAENAARLIEQEGGTYMAGATVFLHDLLELYEQGKYSRHRLQAFISGGAATPPSLIERAENLGIKAARVYGMTETCGPVAQSSASVDLAIRANHDGHIAYGAELEIVDDDHQPLPSNQLGEIRIRSPQMMDGYLNAEETAAQMDADGWFYPGDLGYLDEAGWLSIAGRKKDIINRGGEKFSATDIESALMTHASVLKAAVVGTPDARFGEVVCACLMLRDNHPWQGPQDIIRHLESIGLARPKFPVEWVVLDAFPATATGKVQKQELLRIAVERRTGNTK